LSTFVEGEDRVRVHLERPLEIDVDPALGAGLTGRACVDVLGADKFDFVSPVPRTPVFERTPSAPRPVA
jgi:hypothetical protein